MADMFSVHDQPDFERVYDEDETVDVRRGDLRALLDLATGSMDFGSGMWDEEQTEIARKTATTLGVDPALVTPMNMACKYGEEHRWHLKAWPSAPLTEYCMRCGTQR